VFQYVRVAPATNLNQCAPRVVRDCRAGRIRKRRAEDEQFRMKSLKQCGDEVEVNTLSIGNRDRQHPDSGITEHLKGRIVSWGFACYDVSGFSVQPDHSMKSLRAAGRHHQIFCCYVDASSLKALSDLDPESVIAVRRVITKSEIRLLVERFVEGSLESGFWHAVNGGQTSRQVDQVRIAGLSHEIKQAGLWRKGVRQVHHPKLLPLTEIFKVFSLTFSSGPVLQKRRATDPTEARCSTRGSGGRAFGVSPHGHAERDPTITPHRSSGGVTLRNVQTPELVAKLLAAERKAPGQNRGSPPM